jgi:PAS domain S-box-containing protein
MAEARLPRGSGPKPIKVLILEDNESDFEIIVHELKRSGFLSECAHAFDEAGYLSALGPDLDVILADYHLPQFDALSALRILRERDLRIPFIVVTGSLSEEAAVACLKNGATDYLIKDRLARLGPAIAQALEARKNVEAKHAAETQIRRRNEELTLLNRIIAASAEDADERDIARIACEDLAEATGADQAAILLRAEKGGQAEIIAQYASAGVDAPQSGFIGLDGETMSAILASLRSPAAINDLRAEEGHPKMRAVLAEGGISSAALIPIVLKARNEGCVALMSKRVGAFTEAETGLAKNVADQLANAIARARLERERLRMSAAMEQATDAVVITDSAGRIQYANPAFESITGYPPSEAVGEIACFTCARKGSRHPLQAAIEHGTELRGRMECRSRDGKPFTVDVSFCPVRDKNGNVANYVGVQRDVTQSLQLEQRYLQAQKMEAVGRLAGGVAHDFNNLLTVITGYADVLSLSLGSDAEGTAALSEIKKAAKSAAGLVRKLLTFSRKQVFKPQVLDLNAVLREIQGMLKPILEENIELAMELAPGLGAIRADPGQIEQIVMNLAVNARDAMPKGGKLALSTRDFDADQDFTLRRPEIAPGPYVILEVADTGTGIKEEVLAHIFEPFFTTKEEGKGTGLGLSTVYGIVKQSGGHIATHSKVGEGTRFEMMFPRLSGKAEALRAPGGAKSAPSGSGVVLVIEDNETVRRLAKAVLGRAGYEVLVAESSAEALEYCGNPEPELDLVITDIVMPEVNGIELARMSRASRPNAKVLLISGYAGDAYASVIKSEPGTAFLEKPFTADELLNAVNELIGARRTEPGAP